VAKGYGCDLDIHGFFYFIFISYYRGFSTDGASERENGRTNERTNERASERAGGKAP